MIGEYRGVSLPAARASRPVPAWPARCTVLGIALLPVQLGVSGLSVRVAPSDVLFGVAALLLLASDRVPPGRLLRLWLVLFAVVTWAVVIGTSRGTVLPSAMFDRWVGCLALLFAAFTTSTLDITRLGRGLRAASWVALASHVAVALRPSIGGEQVAGRNAGLLVDPNNAGVMVAALLAIELGRAVDAMRDGRPIGWTQTVLITGLSWSLVETGSRTGWFALGAGIIALLVVNRHRLLLLVHRRVVRSVVFTVVLVVALQAAFDAQFSRLQFRPDNITRRSEVLEQSWETFVESPLTGGGLLHTLQLGFGFPHSSLLWLLGDAGVLGLVAFAAVAIVPLRWLVRRRAVLPAPPLIRPVMIGLATMIVSSFGIEALYQRQWWVLIGAAAGISLTRPPGPSFDAAGHPAVDAVGRR